MPLTLEQYANWLDGRQDLLWPAAPEIEHPKVRPHCKRLPGIRLVTFSVYGTLVAISGGELYKVHPEAFVMEAALEKTIHEFKMWPSMSRKPGKPSEYMRKIYEQICDELSLAVGSADGRYLETRSHDVWQRVVQRLIKNDYEFDVAFYGSLNHFCEKICYFFHSSLQGTGPEPGARAALETLKKKGLILGLLTDGQCFTRIHLLRALDLEGKLTELFSPEMEVFSFEVGARKPSERLFRAIVQRLRQHNLSQHQVLHVGSRLDLDVVPAKRVGFRTALFAGDKSSLNASNKQLNSEPSRPDLLITEIGQLAQFIG